MGNFCTNCGQRSNISRINYKYLLSEVSHNIFQMDKGFFYTIKELFLRPGKSINNYILGKRIQYFKPIAFILLTSAIYVITSKSLGINTYSNEIVSGLSTGLFDKNIEENSILLTFLNWLAKNNAYFLLLTIPFFSLGSYFAFIKSGYNYFEHLVINIYITGQQMIIYSVLNLILPNYSLKETIPFVIGIAFNFWAFYKTFYTIKSLKRVLLTFLTYSFFVIQFFLLIMCSLLFINQ